MATIGAFGKLSLTDNDRTSSTQPANHSGVIIWLEIAHDISAASGFNPSGKQQVLDRDGHPVQHAKLCALLTGLITGLGLGQRSIGE